MEEMCRSSLTNFNTHNSTYVGYIEGEDAYTSFCESFRRHGYCYATRSSMRFDGLRDLTELMVARAQDHTYEELIGPTHMDTDVLVTFNKKFNSYCFVSGRLYMQCTHGHKYKKETSKPRTRASPQTKKFDCPAVFKLVEKIYFPRECDTGKCTKHFLTEVKKMIWDRISKGECPKVIKRYHITISQSSVHNHEVEQSMKIHPVIKSTIYDLVKNGFTTVKAVKTHLQEKVNEMFEGKEMPKFTNTSYYPLDKTIYFHIYNFKNKLQSDEISDDDNVEYTCSCLNFLNDKQKHFVKCYAGESQNNLDVVIAKQPGNENVENNFDNLIDEEKSFDNLVTVENNFDNPVVEKECRLDDSETPEENYEDEKVVDNNKEDKMATLNVMRDMLREMIDVSYCEIENDVLSASLMQIRETLDSMRDSVKRLQGCQSPLLKKIKMCDD